MTKAPMPPKTPTPLKKPMAKRKVIPKSQPPAKGVASTAKPVAELRTEITKKQLIERMMEDSDMKKGDARRAADATLLALANVLRSGADIAAAPLGKVKITKQKETPNGDLVVCRIKLKSPDDTPLAAADAPVAGAKDKSPE